jgi:small subunit ribosomal protein S21
MKDNNYKKTRKYSSKKAVKGGESSQVVVNDPYAHIEAVQAQPLEVKVFNNNFDKALRAFRALVQKERILSSYKENQSYEKPSDKRRRKRNEMKRKRLEVFTDNSTSNKKVSKKTFKPRPSKSDGSPE